MTPRILAAFFMAASSLSFHTDARPLRPLWDHGDLTCPYPSESDRYIDVPLFHDLDALARVERIPGLNLFKDAQLKHRGKKLRIFYELLTPFDPSKRLLILIPGGPGQPHADLHPLVDIFESKGLQKTHNLIAMDHRGVGCSRPLFPGNEPEESMMMRQAASDIEMIRKELVGESGSIDVWGYSYGSLLAQTYALLYPDHLGLFSIGGAVSGYEDWGLAGLQFESLVFSAVGKEDRELFYEFTQDSFEVKRGFFKWAFAQLYDYKGRTERIPKKLAEILQNLKAGREAEVLSQFDAPPDIMPWMARSIACLELFPYKSKFSLEFDIWGEMIGACSEFEGKQEYFNYTDLLPQIHQRTLIYGGNFDHVTTGQAMQRISQKIPNSFLFLNKYMGHGFGGNTDCFSQMTTAFFQGAERENLAQLASSPICQNPPN